MQVSRARVDEQREATRLTELGPRAEEVSGAAAQLRASQAQLALLQHQIEQGELRAPVDAVVRSRLLEPGDMATPQRPVFALALAQPKWVRVYVSETDLGKVKPGTAARITTDSRPGQPLQGTVVHLLGGGVHSQIGTDRGASHQPRLRGARGGRGRRQRPASRPACHGPHSPGPAHDGTPAIVAEALRKTFQRPGQTAVQAVDGVSMAVREGELTALVGPDGAGKTSLMRMMAGLLTADEGTLHVLGRDVAREPQAVQDRISYMPQRFGLYEDLSVQENLDLYADLHGVPQDVRRERFASCSR